MIINELRRTESRLITRQWLGPDTIDAGPTISLGGTHVRDPHGFTRYLYEPTVGGTHTFLVFGTHNSIVGSMIKNLCFLIPLVEKTLTIIF
jgi:hypothetical protein